MPMYDPKFSVKQMYDNYGSSRSTPASRSASAGKQAAASMKSAGIGGLGGRATTSSAQRIQDSFRDMRESSRTSGGTSVVAQDNNPNRDEFENKSTLQKLKEKAINLFESFGAEEPEALIVDNKRVYQGPLFRGYDPTTRIGDFGGEYGKQQYLFGQESLGIFGPGIKTTRSPTPPFLPPSTINMFGVNTDNPRLNTFGVERKSFRGPDPLELSVSPDVPANMDPLTRGLSQAMIPDPVVPTADYKTQAGDTLFSIQKTLKENGINTTVEEIAEINDIGLDGIFGIKPGTELKLPMPNTDAAPKEVKAALEKLTPITMTEEKSLKEQLREYTDYYKKLASDALGIDVETDQSKIEAAVGLSSKQYTIKKGDTLSKIARANGTTLSEMKKANPNIDPDKLRIGQTLKLPQAGAVTETVVPEVVTNTITPVKEGKLNIGKGNRNDYKNQLVYGATPLLSMDYNGGGGKGVEVIVPDWVYEKGPGNIYFDAAQNYINSVIKFANSKGYEGYEARGNSYKNNGVRSTTMNNNRGIDNVIHIEPFFHEDKKMVDIVNKHKEEFFDLYYNAFKDLPTTIIPPHGTTKKGIVDPGAPSDTLGSELSFGREAAEYLTNKYGNK